MQCGSTFYSFSMFICEIPGLLLRSTASRSRRFIPGAAGRFDVTLVFIQRFELVLWRRVSRFSTIQSITHNTINTFHFYLNPSRAVLRSCQPPLCTLSHLARGPSTAPTRSALLQIPRQHNRTYLFHHVPKKPARGFWSFQESRLARAAALLWRFWFMSPAKCVPELEVDDVCIRKRVVSSLCSLS
jgi:hypothetical protein